MIKICSFSKGFRKLAITFVKNYFLNFVVTLGQPDLLIDQANLREQLIRPLVPLFLGAFSNTPPNEVREKFGDGMNDFAGLCATYLVRELDSKMSGETRHTQGTDQHFELCNDFMLSSLVDLFCDKIGR